MIALETIVLDGLGNVEARADSFTGVQVDSRRVALGDLFVAVGGGSAFVDDALIRGAAVTLERRASKLGSRLSRNFRSRRKVTTADHGR